jgi:hypothetical protein
MHNKEGKKKLDTGKGDNKLQCLFHAAVYGNLHQR